MPAKTDRSPPPQRFVDSYLAYLLARSSELVSQQFHQELEARQVPAVHWRVLATLVDAPMPVTDLARIALQKQPTMSKIVDRMEALDLVRREPGVADRRSTVVSITDHGRTVVRPLLRLARKHEKEVLAPLGEADARLLVGMLRKLIAQQTGTDVGAPDKPVA